MKVSRKTDYALRVLVTLAGEAPETVLSIRRLAERNDVPRRFLEQIMIELRAQGWVRAVAGRAQPATPRAEQALAEHILPRNTERAVTWAAASMELGAVVCTSRSPDCASCPIANRCAWRAAGHPESDLPGTRTQAWHGTDRQCRGRLMAHLRGADQPVPAADLVYCWPDDDTQRERCLASLVTDGLVIRVDEHFALPH